MLAECQTPTTWTSVLWMLDYACDCLNLSIRGNRSSERAFLMRLQGEFAQPHAERAGDAQRDDSQRPSQQ